MTSTSSSSVTTQFTSKWLTPTFFDKLHDYWFQGYAPDAVMPTEEVIKRWFGQSDANDEYCRDQYSALLHEAQSLSISPVELVTPSDTPLEAVLLIILFDQISRNIFRGVESQRCFNIFDRIALDISLRSLFPETYRSGEILRQQQQQHSLHSTNQDDTQDVENHDRKETWYDDPSISLHPADINESLSSTKSLDTTHPSFRYHLGYRMWFYLPLMHSESIKIHEWAKTRYEAMKNDMKNLPESLIKEQKITPEQVIAYVEKLESYEISHREIIERFGRYPHRNKPLGRTHTKEEKEYLDGGGLTFGAEHH